MRRAVAASFAAALVAVGLFVPAVVAVALFVPAVMAAPLAAAGALDAAPLAAARGPDAAAPVAAQAPSIPSVGVTPVGTSSTDPNAGQWFVATLAPGQSGRLQARIANPARVPQTVRLYLADLTFGPDGTPQVIDPPRSTDVGTWGTFDSPTVTVPALGAVVASFTITVPQGADPGDHVGVLVAEASPEGEGPIKVVKRVATRLYVTVPGDARRDFTIETVSVSRDWWLFPRQAWVRVVLRNTGRVRLEPSVTVNGRPARGPGLLLARSVEAYVAAVPIPFWGGPQVYRIEATTRAGAFEGPIRLARASMFVIPWHLVVLAALAVALALALRALARRLGGRYRALEADLRRLERLLEARAEPPSAGGGPDDPELAIRAAIKQARRAGDRETEGRLLAALEAIRGSNGSAAPRRARAAGGPGPARRRAGR